MCSVSLYANKSRTCGGIIPSGSLQGLEMVRRLKRQSRSIANRRRRQCQGIWPSALTLWVLSNHK